MLSTPVQLTAGTTYVVSYLAPNGRYATTSGFFGTPFTNGALTAPASGNGRYLYGATGGYPSYSYQATNYWVDVVFEADPSVVNVTSRTPADGATGVPADATPRISFAEGVQPSGWTMTVKQGGTAVPGSAALSPDGTQLTFTPTAQLAASTTYTVEVAGVRSADGVALATQTWSFTTAAATAPVVRLLDGLTPTSDVSDSPLELGMAFTSSAAGSVTGLRFWKSTANTGTHTGSLWSSSGTRLATVTFTNESASGWQTAEFSSPVAITPGQTYVISYFSPNGRYSVTGAYFAQARSSGPLTAPAGSNGLYKYGAGGGFPTGSWNSTNYFVDVLFRPAS